MESLDEGEDDIEIFDETRQRMVGSAHGRFRNAARGR